MNTFTRILLFSNDYLINQLVNQRQSVNRFIIYDYPFILQEKVRKLFEPTVSNDPFTEWCIKSLSGLTTSVDGKFTVIRDLVSNIVCTTTHMLRSVNQRWFNVETTLIDIDDDPTFVKPRGYNVDCLTLIQRL